MGTPYIGEIRMFGSNYAPDGWALCNGQSLAVAQFDTLYALIGNTYGGDGTNFNVPDLRGRVPVHQGNGAVFAQSGGTETVTLTSTQLPQHRHGLQATTAAPSVASPKLAYPAMATSTGVQGLQTYAKPETNAPLVVQSISPDGGGLAHNNIQPYACITFIISLFGVYPSPN